MVPFRKAPKPLTDSPNPENTLICKRGNNKIPTDKRCPVRVHLRVKNPNLIASKLGKKRKIDGSEYDCWRHSLKIELEEARNKLNYEVKPVKSPCQHNHPAPVDLAPLQKVFKENSVKRSFDKKRVEFNTEYDCLPAEWDGDLKKHVSGEEKYQKKLISARLARRWTAPQGEVAIGSRTLLVQNPLSTRLHARNSIHEQFLQSEISTRDGLPIKIWGLISEFALLHDQDDPCFIDGTFNFCSKLPSVYQQYSFVKYFKSADGKKGLSYPVLFMWLPNKRKDTYRIAFNEVRRLYKEHYGHDLYIGNWRVDYEGNPAKIIKEFWPLALVYGCQFHYAKAIIKNWGLKLGCKKLVYDKELRAKILNIYLGMPFVDPIIVEEAIRKLETEVIPSVCPSKRSKLEAFHKYFIDTWIKKRHANADWNLHELLKRGDTFWTTNQSESLHFSLKNSYTTPPPSIRVASEVLNDYKSFFHGKYVNGQLVPRKLESLERAKNIMYHHAEVERQASAWKIENAVSICLQFSSNENLQTAILNCPSDFVTDELVYTVL
ncbi:Oidioi.mRNA.OKI2018_I69.chr1.g2990.t1.cds [Oikopleura dioica]|uniref:Oidioi.mRNA.OKI2018_I69.chr1.g2990.t1.cds n=1 Tax=Oikopleura dioica TaxID=34765 RepID=A0ABN7SSS1_OIKDI|nr:Oidioi.mRNA.OKI2018_I69.chr1.g2990.t1.cds [Oikopleura dioica]